jgi:hypothetical protein
MHLSTPFLFLFDFYLEAKKQKKFVEWMKFEGDEAPERRYGLDLLLFKHFIYVGSKINIYVSDYCFTERILASRVC